MDKQQWLGRAARLLAEQASVLITQIDCCGEDEEAREKLQQVEAAVKPLIEEAEQQGAALGAEVIAPCLLLALLSAVCIRLFVQPAPSQQHHANC